MPKFQFQIKSTKGLARRGGLQTAHGSLATPAFMPVATLGAVKGLGPQEVQALGFELLLSNTYHLHLNPGEATVAALGGIQKFSGWRGGDADRLGRFSSFLVK